MLFPFKKNLFLLVLCLIVLCNSCANKKDIVYFQNARDFETMVDTETFVPRLKVNDLLDIQVSTYDLEASKPFNIYKGHPNNPSSESVDYLIDVDGNIDYPVLGKIKLKGLTIEEAKNLFKEKLSEGYIKDPVVNIRLKNFRITISGEVRTPGVYTVSGERITILEALGLAGDLTIKGRRDNITVIRDFDGNKTITRIDLTSKEVFNSPVYFLTQNDVVYVEPNRSAISSSAFDNRVSTAISIASIVITSTILLLTR